jgi:hypothetical protein
VRAVRVEALYCPMLAGLLRRLGGWIHRPHSRICHPHGWICGHGWRPRARTMLVGRRGEPRPSWWWLHAGKRRSAGPALVGGGCVRWPGQPRGPPATACQFWLDLEVTRLGLTRFSGARGRRCSWRSGRLHACGGKVWDPREHAVATGPGHSGGMQRGTAVAPPLVVCHDCGPGVAGLGACSGLGWMLWAKVFTDNLPGGDGGDVFGCRSPCWGCHLGTPPPLHGAL